MKKRAQNFVIDSVGFAGFLFLVGTGVLMRYVLPPGSGTGLTVWGMDRHGWGSIHFWLAVTFLSVLAIHLFLHWKWILAMVQGRPREESGMRVGLGMAGLAALITLALSPVVSPVARDLSGGSHENEIAAVSDQVDPVSQTAAGPADLLSAWVDLWASYDLSDVRRLFLDDARLTYFSSETEGLIVGFEAVHDHHAGFGFVEGGGQPGSELWVDEVTISDFGRTAIVAAVWYFGDPADMESAQKGPMTMVVVDDGSGHRIAHMHFAEYLATETE